MISGQSFAHTQSRKAHTLYISKNTTKQIFIVFLLFIGIYEPVLFPFSLRHIIGLYSLIYAFLHWRLINRLFSKQFLYILFGAYLLIVLYIGIVTFINGNPIWTAEVQNIHMLIYILPFCLTIISKCWLAGIDQKGFLTLVIWTASIQSIIALACLLFDGLRSTIMNLYLSNIDQTTVDKLTRFTFRMFGLASNYTSFMSYFQAFVAIICFYRAFNKSNKYYIIGLLISVSALINTRTSGILLVVGIAICLFKVKNITASIRAIFIIMITVLLFSNLIDLFARINPEGFNWWLVELNKLMNTLNTGDTSVGFASYFVKESTWEIPHDLLQLLFGTGVRVMGGSIYGVRTDVGYINDIWYGGIVYTVLLYFGIFRWMKKELNSTLISGEFKITVHIMFILLLIINIKGQSFRINDCYIVFIMMLLFAHVENHISHDETGDAKR